MSGPACIPSWKTRGGDGLASTNLPAEVWGRIASFLTLREYCVLASTCRAFWAMDLAVVNLLAEPQTEDILDVGFDVSELVRHAWATGDGSAIQVLTAQAPLIEWHAYWHEVLVVLFCQGVAQADPQIVCRSVGVGGQALEPRACAHDTN